MAARKSFDEQYEAARRAYHESRELMEISRESLVREVERNLAADPDKRFGMDLTLSAYAKNFGAAGDRFARAHDRYMALTRREIKRSKGRSR